MQKLARLLIRALKLLGIISLGSLLMAILIAFKQLLATPQPLDSVLPGEQHIYRWKHGHIFYTVLGKENAPPVVLIHALGIGASSYEMRQIMPDLAKHHRVYALDLLGFGLSDHPNIAYSPEVYTSLLQAFLAEVVSQPATLLASGLSGLYARTVARREPALCERLILISPPTLFKTDQSRLRSLLLSPLLGSLLYALISSRPFLHYILLYQSRSRINQLSREERDYLYASAHQLEAEHAPLALLAGKLTTPDVSSPSQTREPAQPILVLTHEKSAQPQASNPPIRQFSIISQAGRLPHLGAPDQVISTILAWEKQLPTPETAELASEQTDNLETSAKQSHMEIRPAPIQDKTDLPIKKNTVSARPHEKPASQATQEAAKEQKALIHQPAEETPTVPHATFTRVEAYCLKCKKKNLMKDVHPVTLKNGRPAIQGFCTVCGTRLSRMGKHV